MKRMMCATLIGVLAFSVGVNGQTRRPNRAPSSDHTPASVPVQVQRPAQPPWYEKGLAQINPQDLDFGTWLEQRRRTFVEAKIANPYFEYSLWMTVALLVAGAMAIKLQTDKGRIIRVTAETMVDLRNQEILSHKVTEEAIRRHNEHIDICNRAFVMENSGEQPVGFSSSTLESELRRVGDELQRANAEIARLTQDNEAKARTLAGLSLRLEGITGDPAKNQPMDLSTADGKLIQHINTLQEKLHVQEKDKRKLRGA
ncbi:MAG TPA: hypothetical protein VKZ53_23775 [Candidatus Angelobacter sp.]|nr:hypothetical protein [Candidatus Angelobacter sp.]